MTITTITNEDLEIIVKHTFRKQVEQLAKVVYNAYGNHADWRNYQGNPMPKWEELPVPIAMHWIAAMQAIFVTYPSDYKFE